MKINSLLCVALVLGCLFGCSTSGRYSVVVTGGIDKELTTQVSDLLVECQKIKPGMTRSELLRVFIAEGGIFTAQHRTFVHRRCPYIKVDVDFNLSGRTSPGTNAEQGDDIVRSISKPYLDWTVID